MNRKTRESLVYRSSGQHQGKIDAYSLRAKERRPKASIASSSIRSAADDIAAPSPTTRGRTKDGTNRSNAEIGQELTKREDRLPLMFSFPANPCHEESTRAIAAS